MSLDSLKIEVPDPDDLTDEEVHRHLLLSRHLPGFSGTAEHSAFVEQVKKQQAAAQ